MKSSTMYGPVPNGLMLSGASRDLAPTKSFRMCFGRIWPFVADERHVPAAGRLLERDLDGHRVDRLDLVEVGVGAERRRGGVLVGDELEGEDDVVGGERLAVRPLDARSSACR